MPSDPAWCPHNDGAVEALLALFRLIIMAGPGSTCPLCRTQVLAVIGGPSFNGNLLLMALPILAIALLVAGVSYACHGR